MKASRAAETARILIEALPYLQNLAQRTIVIKYGGNAMIDETLQRGFADNIVLLKQVGIHPVIVHGGGPQIDTMLQRLDIPRRFIGGQRVTDKQTMDVVEMVLGGQINKAIVNRINRSGGRAVGLTGKDAGLIRAGSFSAAASDNHLGRVEHVHPELLHKLVAEGFIPVISPIGVDADGKTYNINADQVAARLAAVLAAEKLLLLTNTRGVLDADGKLLSELSCAQGQQLIVDQIVQGGMLPKLQAAVDALQNGVASAHILDGRQENAVLLELFTDRGIGSLIKHPAP